MNLGSLPECSRSPWEQYPLRPRVPQGNGQKWRNKSYIYMLSGIALSVVCSPAVWLLKHDMRLAGQFRSADPAPLLGESRRRGKASASKSLRACETVGAQAAKCMRRCSCKKSYARPDSGSIHSRRRDHLSYSAPSEGAGAPRTI